MKQMVGSMAYDFIHGNMHCLLCERFNHSKYEPISEGKFRFDELRLHLDKHNAPLLVTIAEDATRI